MSFFFTCCSENIENDYFTQDMTIETKVSGKDRILRLNQQENFQEYTKYFQDDEVKNIFENDYTTTNDIFNLNRNNQMFNIKNLNQCVFCGGEKCKYEDPSLYEKCAIKGLNSDLFYDCIYASQRPSSSLIKQYDLVNTFKKNNIKLIVNCQINGEHQNCGPNRGLELDNGYTYSPSLFISENIEVLNCGFEEMSAPFTFDFIIDIVKKIAYVIKYKNGRVLVHSHSGNGRTCLVIACFFIYYFNQTAEQAINELRKRRKNAINNYSQEEYCRKFEIYVNILKKVFIKKQMSIENFIKYQMDMDFNLDENLILPSIIPLYFNRKNTDNNINEISSEVINIRYIPKILLICLDKIIQIKNKNGIKNDKLYQILNGMNKISKEEINQLQIIKKEINKNNWELLNINENLLIITELLFSWINESVIECINPKKIERLWNKSSKLFNDKINKENNQNTNSFDEFMKGNSPINKKKIYQFMNIFNLIFSKTEYEIMKYISIFLSLIYPFVNKENNNSKNEIKEYVRFIYKISFFLLGYNLDKVNALSDKKNLKEMNDVKKFILIFEFFIFFIYKEENKIINNNNSNNDWINKYLELKKEYEENKTKDTHVIMEFFKKKPKLNLISVKYYFSFDYDKPKDDPK